MKIQVSDFNLEATLESGQVFGFKKDVKNVFEGVVSGIPVRLWQKGQALYVQTASQKETLDAVWRYFDLDRDLTPVYEILCEDERLAKTCETFRGLRIIRQDAWEALACFILSSNNNVKRIQGIWRNLSGHFNKCAIPMFPAPLQIAKSHEKILRHLGLGYRAPFLLCTAKFVAANPECLEAIREAPYEEAKARVLAFPGIGEKVADCVLLYGFQKYKAFPVDVWILRVMRKLYFRNRKVSETKVREFGQKRWGSLAGYVQQYLFHGVRKGVL